jgi:hypothetical protein
MLPAAGVFASLWLSSAVLGAISSEIPRRPDGRPDLSGTYDVATLTPLARPSQFGDQASLTEEEAKAYAAHWADNVAKDFEPSDPNRNAPADGGVAFAIPEFEGASGGTGVYNTFYLELGESTFQLDGKYPTSIIYDPASGQMPPLTEKGQARLAERAAQRNENNGAAWWLDQDAGPYDDPERRPLAERCLIGFGPTAGPPALPNYWYNNLKRIVQTDDAVVILAEMVHDARIIRIGGEHDDPEIRGWFGDSVGRWEGDTLVAETINFLDTPALTQGSRNMRVTERFRRLDAETLLYEFTVDDPTIWERPWSGRYPWRATDARLFEYACHEGNYALGGILRGARQLEREAREATP